MEDVLQTTATHCQPEILRNIIHFSVSSLTACEVKVKTDMASVAGDFSSHIR